MMRRLLAARASWAALIATWHEWSAETWWRRARRWSRSQNFERPKGERD